ncbi:PIN domain-containing protein [Fulvimarina endophytica]|nr:PIN domain-containing protein [Fulvimarina endophytica]
MQFQTCLKTSICIRRSRELSKPQPRYRPLALKPTHENVEPTSRTAHLFLIDTNIVSALKKPWAYPRVVSWIEAAPMGSLAISWSTVFELQYGVERARNAGSHRADAYEDALCDLIEDPRFQVLHPTTDAARIRGRMHATPALRNFWIAHPESRKHATGEDLTIAATAIAAGAVIVTLNVRDFVQIGRHFRLPGLIELEGGE